MIDLFMNLMQIPPQMERDRDLYAKLPSVGGANGKKIEEVRQILASIENKESQVWTTILREFGPRL